jgi:site-specific DNA recombinase
MYPAKRYNKEEARCEKMKTETVTFEDVLREIESGKYRDFYLDYERRSTDDNEHQKNSLKYQRTEIGAYAHRENLPIAPLTIEGFCREGSIGERHSAFKDNTELVFTDGTIQYRIERPKFARLVEWLIKGYFKGAIFYCWDRASRNKSDETILRKLMKMGVDIRFVTAKYDKSSAGELHMDVDGMFSAHHSRVTSEKVSMTIKNSRARGLITNKAPAGYENNGTMDNKSFDPERAPIVRKLFEMYDSGEWSLADLARWATEQGFTMPPMRRRRTRQEILAEEEDDIRLHIDAVCRPPTYNSIHKILTNRTYTGRTRTKDGEWIPSTSHKALVDDDVFERVQARLRKKNKSKHYAKLLGHPLRRLVYCGVCGRTYTPYPQKGIMYYGARCDKKCTNSLKNFNFDYIADKVGTLMSRLSFTEEELADLDARSNTEIALLETKRFNQLESGERRKKKIREDLAYLHANRLTLIKTKVYTPEEYVAEEARLNGELAELREAEKASDIAMQETVKEVVMLSELLKDLYPTYKDASPHEKEEIITQIFSELTLTEDTLNYKCKNGFRALESRFGASCDPTGNRTRVPCLKSMCPNR